MDLKLIIIFVIYYAVYTSALNVRPSFNPPGELPPENDRPDDRIINGFTPGQFEVPWVVLLSIQLPVGGAACTGTIISSEWVVTAGHCANGSLSIQVQLGLYNRTFAPDQVINVPASRMIIHPNFVANRSAIMNDIALLHLVPKADTSFRSIKPITYACPSSGNFAGRTGLACGWGITSDNATTIANIIQCVNMPIITNTECIRTWGGYIKPTNICTRNVKFHTTCSGDSGGPLAVSDGTSARLKLIGATSFGSKPCATTAPAAFTRITSYSDWIKCNTGVICDPN